MPSQLTEEELGAWRAFLIAHHQVIRTLDQELMRDHSIPLGSYEVLLRLYRTPGHCLRMSDLARGALLSPSGLTRLVDRLAEAGLVVRKRQSEDGRTVYAHLTDAGVGRFKRAARTHVRGIRQHFTERFTPEQLTGLRAALEVLQAQPCPPEA